MKKLISLGIAIILFVAVVALTAPAMVEPAKAEANDYMLIFYDGHMHTIFSDGSGTVSDVVATALSRGLDAVIITDHSENLTLDEWDWLVSNCSSYTNGTFLCLPGFEMTGSESIFMRDHFNVYNVSTPFIEDELVPSEKWPSPHNPNGTGPLSPENLTNWVNWAHSQGGIVVHNHPTGHTKRTYGVDLIEIYNRDFIDEINAIGESLPEWLGGPYHGAGYILNNLVIYGERDLTQDLRNAIYNATKIFYQVGIWFGAPQDPLNSWDSFLLNYSTEVQDYVAFAVGNTDSHNTGTPDSKVGLAKVGVYVKNFTANDLYEGIKKGHSFVTTGPIISFNVSDAIMGETLVLGGGVLHPILNVKVESSAPSVNLVNVTIVKNGLPWKTFWPNLTSFETRINDTNVPNNSYYRIEVVEYDPILNKTNYAYSNPIFVKVKLVGDTDGNGKINILDIGMVGIAFGSKPGDQNWNAVADIDYNRRVNILDIGMVAIHFGEKDP